MADNVNNFYDSLTSLAEVQKLIVRGDRESATLEYKEAFEEWKDSAKKEIAKDVSAMANSEGGVIIYGVKTGKGDDKTKPIEITSMHPGNTHERLVQIVNSNIRNEILGWDCKPLFDAGKSVLVVSIPKSTRSPHQCVQEARYYFRSGTENLRMEHHLVELYFGKRQAPRITVTPCIRMTGSHSAEWVKQGYSNEYELSLRLKNTGVRSAKDISVFCELPNTSILRLPFVGPDLLRSPNPISERPSVQTYSVTLSLALHPEMEISVAQFHFKPQDNLDAFALVQPFFCWRVFAEGMLPESGSVSLADLVDRVLHGR